MTNNILDMANKVIPPKDLKMINQVPLKKLDVDIGFKSYSFLEISETPEVDVDWLVEDILPSVGLAQISGTQKSGKSFFSLQLGLSIATGSDFLGRSIEQGNVLYLDCEGSLDRLNRRMSAQLEGLGIPKSEALKNTRAVFGTDCMNNVDGGMEAIDAWRLSVAKPRLVIIDTLSRWIVKGKGSNPVDVDTRAFAPLQEYAIKHNICILFIHHTRKGDGESEDYQDKSSGTRGLSAVADCNILLSKVRGEDRARLRGDGRDVTDFDLSIKSESIPKRGFWWKLEGDYEKVQINLSHQKIIEEANELEQGLQLTQNRYGWKPKELWEAMNIPKEKQNSKYVLLGRMRKDLILGQENKYYYLISPTYERKEETPLV
tara:strand:+ start:1385 stop:2506 length:1122 start_codon:yes stop_codon:yes gene_type:complete